METENVIDLDERRSARPTNRVKLSIIGRAANTGTRPFLGLASDNNSYWCKRLHSGHEWQAAVNEVAACVVGEALGAPVRPWKIVEVPRSLQGILHGELGFRLGSYPLFGSLQLETADLALEAERFLHVRDDSNYNRIPHLIALHILCNAQDIQFMYDSADDYSIWSIDHGLWFGSDEIAWALLDETHPYGRTTVPHLSTPIDHEHWERAVRAVEQLPANLAAKLRDALPEEWEIPASDSDKLMAYVTSRQAYTIDRLKELQARSGRR